MPGVTFSYRIGSCKAQTTANYFFSIDMLHFLMEWTVLLNGLSTVTH